ncbi:mechanosensitive ion channel family protein [Luteipulveratus sp. YIM 133132]|uniref:Mechanosensitive ion channel family protein n=1 Tax=Luteipulveratus flavus TaxID=3031728 RepID=A0ABT6CBE3_9MICO|nr:MULTISPECIES: mechanosensitive ion channel family protein [unclassified Luteipulveratus]MDE9366285.1 mechanosensitive ion channel family protein [Luteipulveratus sp. YIM 133132]MDF8265374.1 mechanosensitive ion channel family protein [Luteipulveratus sp. YIM 133296]
MSWDWLTGSGGGPRPLMLIGVVLGAVVVRWVIHRLIRRAVRAMESRQPRLQPSASRVGRAGRAGRVLRQAAGLDHERRRQRAATMGSILRSITTIVVFTIAALTLLAELGVPLAPLMASAGVGGVAIGFGAQSLVKDFLSGVFMILEDQYGVGDVIDTGEAIGTVEEVSLRVTRLRDANGVVWYIRNGEIVRIGNRSQGWSTALVDIPVAYDQPVEKVLSVLREVVATLDHEQPWEDRLLDTPEVAGVESVTGGVMTVRIMARCAPNENFSVSRELRERSKVALDEAGIRGPGFAAHGAEAAVL